MGPEQSSAKALVAIHASGSAGVLQALVNVQRAGKTAVLCSAREPAERVQAWLDALGCSEHYPIDPGLASYQTPKDFVDFSGATLIRTSGSSGEPKSVLHTWEQHVANARAVVSQLGLGPQSRLLLSLPLHHVGGFGIWVRSLLSGAEVVLPRPDWTLDWAIREQKVTHLSLVATQLLRLMRESCHLPLLRSLSAIVLGGGPVPQMLVEWALAENLPIVTSYGLTEMASQVCATQIGEGAPALFSSGRVLPERELMIGPGSEIFLKGPMLSTSARRDLDGWFHTGDRGWQDGGGYLHVQGRIDNMMISGGENIHPEEIEKALLGHPNVAAALVVAVPHPEFGQRPAAFVKGQDGELPSTFALRDFLGSRLARFQIPDHFWPWPKDAPEAGIKAPRAWFAARALQIRAN